MVGRLLQEPAGGALGHVGGDVAADRFGDPAAITRYLGQIDDLSTALMERADRMVGSAAASYRSLIEGVIVYPVPAYKKLDMEIRGYLAALVQNPGHAPNRRLCGFMAVAEDRYTPKPRPLFAFWPRAAA